MLKTVILYTDGACSGNPGVGGWSAILSYKGAEKVISGGETNTTNNRMELLAVINGLKTIKEKCNVKVYSDSQYVISAFNDGWVDEWLLKDFRRNTKNPVKNSDLWLELISLTSVHNVEFIKVKGHADNEQNNRCDKLARNEILKIQSKN